MYSNELQTIRAFLEAQSTLALATIDANGNPQVAPLFYVSDDALNLYWLSSADSRHSINLMAREQVAATIYPAAWHWTEIRGLQIEGTAHLINDDTLRQDIVARYSRKFDLPSGFETIITGSELFVLKPAWVRWLDNSVRFGHKSEIQF
jgi:uncharacterized protein YhbP (UPF0306 family)